MMSIVWVDVGLLWIGVFKINDLDLETGQDMLLNWIKRRAGFVFSKITTYIAVWNLYFTGVFNKITTLMAFSNNLETARVLLPSLLKFPKLGQNNICFSRNSCMLDNLITQLRIRGHNDWPVGHRKQITSSRKEINRKEVLWLLS